VPGSLTFSFWPRVKKSLFGNRIGPLISFLRSSSTTMSATDAGLLTRHGSDCRGVDARVALASRPPSSSAPTHNPHSTRRQLPATSCLGAFLGAGSLSGRRVSLLPASKNLHSRLLQRSKRPYSMTSSAMTGIAIAVALRRNEGRKTQSD
jgi:hypothetical protein